MMSKLPYFQLLFGRVSVISEATVAIEAREPLLPALDVAAAFQHRPGDDGLVMGELDLHQPHQQPFL